MYELYMYVMFMCGVCGTDIDEYVHETMCVDVGGHVCTWVNMGENHMYTICYGHVHACILCSYLCS